MTNEFDFDFDPAALGDSLFVQERQSYPTITWNVSGGYWMTDAENFEQAPDGWQLHDEDFGTVWATRRLRCAILGVRRGWEVNDPAGVRHFYPLYTKAEDRAPGQLKSKVQAAVALPDDERVFVIALRGYVKSVSWDNEPGRFHKPEFPAGAWPTVRAYAQEASKATGKNLPALGAWWVDLVPVTGGDGKPAKLRVGTPPNTSMATPFTADLSTAATNPDMPERRFVGMEALLRFQQIREDEIIPWEQEWDTPAAAVTDPDGDEWDAMFEQTVAAQQPPAPIDLGDGPPPQRQAPPPPPPTEAEDLPF